MHIELATMEDMIHELRRRKVRFVFIGVEPSNSKHAAIQVGAFGKDLTEVLRLLRAGRSALEESPKGESGDTKDGRS
jgi:alkyl hydroperoxide reductase subunit AhpC